LTIGADLRDSPLAADLLVGFKRVSTQK